MKKKDVKDRNILKYETLSMIGYFKIFGDLFHYNIKEMTDIFVTKDEYSLSSIEKKFEIVEAYYVNLHYYLLTWVIYKK